MRKRTDKNGEVGGSSRGKRQSRGGRYRPRRATSHELQSINLTQSIRNFTGPKNPSYPLGDGETRGRGRGRRDVRGYVKVCSGRGTGYVGRGEGVTGKGLVLGMGGEVGLRGGKGRRGRT